MPYVAESSLTCVFGAASTSKNYLERHRNPARRYVLVDNDQDLWGTEFAGLCVQDPAILADIEFSEVVVAFSHVADVLRQLESSGIPRDCITVPAKRQTSVAQFVCESDREEAWRALNEVLHILTSLGIECIVEQGVALGFFRDGDFIPGDQDIDISVPQALIGRTEFSADIARRLRMSSSIHSAKISKTASVTSIELTSRSGVPICIFGRRTESGVSRSSLPLEEVPEALLYPPSWVNVRDGKVPLPRDPEGYLTHVYGSGWRTPNPDFTYLDYANLGA